MPVTPPKPTTPPPSPITPPAGNMTTTTTTTTAIRPHAPAQPSMPSFQLDMGTIVGLIVGVLLLIFVIAFVAILIVRAKRGMLGGSQFVSVRSLEDGIKDPSVDAVGLLLDLDDSSAKIIPLRRIESFYISKDPNRPAVVISNPYGRTFNIHGKPLIVAVSAGKMGYQSDVVGFTSLGLAQLAIEDDLWRNVTEPQKSYELLVQRISTLIQNRWGRLRLAPGTVLAFEMSPPNVLTTMIRQTLDMLNAVVSNLVNFSSAIESIANAIKTHKLQEMQAKGRLLFIILMGAGMASLLVGIALWLLRGGI